MKPSVITQEVFLQVQEQAQSKSLTNKEQRKLRQKLKAMEFREDSATTAATRPIPLRKPRQPKRRVSNLLVLAEAFRGLCTFLTGSAWQCHQPTLSINEEVLAMWSGVPPDLLVVHVHDDQMGSSAQKGHHLHERMLSVQRAIEDQQVRGGHCLLIKRYVKKGHEVWNSMRSSMAGSRWH
eukprot:5602033-Amphidinium_carterae.1